MAVKMPQSLRDRLETEYGQPMVRVTLRSAIGVYAMQLTSYDGRYEVGVYHWQDRPQDAAREVTTIEENIYPEYIPAYKRLNEAIQKEFDRGLVGYTFQKDEPTLVTAYKYLKAKRQEWSNIVNQDVL